MGRTVIVPPVLKGTKMDVVDGQGHAASVIFLPIPSVAAAVEGREHTLRFVHVRKYGDVTHSGVRDRDVDEPSLIPHGARENLLLRQKRPPSWSSEFRVVWKSFIHCAQFVGNAGHYRAYIDSRGAVPPSSGGKEWIVGAPRKTRRETFEPRIIRNEMHVVLKLVGKSLKHVLMKL